MEGPVSSTSVFGREEPGGVILGGGGSSTTFTRFSVFVARDLVGFLFQHY